MNADELAKACADSMWANDNASKGLGMEIVEIKAGRIRKTLYARAR